MNRVSGASALIAAGAALFATASAAAGQECPVLLRCAGMELTQNATPDESAPDDNSASPPADAAPNGEPDSGNAQSPDDGSGDDDDGGNSNQASPPGSGDPPGCIFQDRPLELLV